MINLITELPNILPPGETKSKCTHLIHSCLAKEKKFGADLRRVAIQLYLLLKDLDCSCRVLFLLQSITKIGEIAYARDDKRCPRQLLQLYNMCWIHMELCNDLFSTPEKLSKAKMFGHYVHALTAHIPTQLELACLRSLNTESQERLFGQARAIADACTNHHSDNVIPQIKQEQHEVLVSVKKREIHRCLMWLMICPNSPALGLRLISLSREKTVGRYISNELVHFLLLVWMFGGPTFPCQP